MDHINMHMPIQIPIQIPMRIQTQRHKSQDQISNEEYLTELGQEFGLPNWLDLEFLAEITLALLMADEELGLGLFYDDYEEADGEVEDEEDAYEEEEGSDFDEFGNG